MNIIDTKTFIRACDYTNKSPLIEGVHGLGKSEIIRQFAKEEELHCETLILSLMDVSDLMGMPRTSEVGGSLTTLWAAPDWFNRITNAAFPTSVNFEDLNITDSDLKDHLIAGLDINKPLDRGEINRLYSEFHKLPNDVLRVAIVDDLSYKYAKRSVLFVDEFNRAPVDILNASLQLVLDKRLHSHVLPIVNGKPTFVVAAINPADADYTVNTFDPALLDRFVYGKIEPDAKAWLEWARLTNQAPIVRDFIAEHPDRIHFEAKDGTSTATPRSWTALANIMEKIEKIPGEVQFQLMKGCIGQELASQFLAYFNNYFKVVKLEDIEKLVKTKAKTTKDIEKIAVHVEKLVGSQESVQKTELAENMFKKYMKKDKYEDALPLMAYLYALDLEILNGFLKTKKESDFEDYMKLSEFDGKLNNKGLFKKIVTKIQQ